MPTPDSDQPYSVARAGGRNGSDEFALSSVIFIRLLALVHVIAFASALTQIQALVGVHGIAPAADYFAAAKAQLHGDALRQLPSLCWWFGAGSFLTVLTVIGIGTALLLFVGVAPVACLVILWAAYLSLVNAGQMFFGYQWDGLLLEATLAAIFIAPWRWLPGWRAEPPPAVGRIVVWWLTFRLMFLAGVVKLASGDETWRHLTALTFHYETQPLPTVLAWYAHQAPLWWHQFECAMTFVIELGLPFLLWLPRRPRHTAALVLAAFMAAIALTGNYTFFNLLAIALCLFCLDDAAWLGAFRSGPRRRHAQSAAAVTTDEPSLPDAPLYRPLVRRRIHWPSTVRGRLTVAFAAVAFGYTGVLTLLNLGLPLTGLPGFETAATYLEPFRSFNSYGLFAVMTHPRTELVIEGSYDGQDWHEYDFKYKPGALDARPKFVAPLQPRLDWQLWFAALGSPEQNPWVLSLVEHLLRGTPVVLHLLGHNPFADRPPKFIRILRYEYHFTDAATRARTGHWWSRTLQDVYLAPSTLR